MALGFCEECGKQISDKARACPNCGAVIGTSKSRTTAVVLALFLGGLGFHKFYLNRPIAGLLYVVFCWTFIPALFGLIEALNFAFMSDNTFRERFT